MDKNFPTLKMKKTPILKPRKNTYSKFTNPKTIRLSLLKKPAPKPRKSFNKISEMN